MANSKVEVGSEVEGNETKKQSSFWTIFSVWNHMIGASLLAMAWGFNHAGLFLSIFIIIMMSLMVCYTAWIIAELYRVYGKDIGDGDIGEICTLLYGRVLDIASKVFAIFLIFGAIMLYWILMSNFLYLLVNLMAGSNKDVMTNNAENDSTYDSVWNLKTAPVFLTILVLPTVSLKSPLFFTKFNAFGTIAICYVILFIIINAGLWGVHVDLHDADSKHYTKSFSSNFPALSGMLGMALATHPSIITIIRNNKKQDNNIRDLLIGYTLGSCTYLFCGLLFYITFPDKKTEIEDNIFNNFEIKHTLAVIGRSIFLFQLYTNYVLVTYAFRRIVLFELFGNIYPGFIHVTILNLSVILVCVIIAIFLPKVGTVVRYSGSFCGMLYIFALPCVLYLLSLKKREKLTKIKVGLLVFIMIFGVANFLGQFFVEE